MINFDRFYGIFKIFPSDKAIRVIITCDAKHYYTSYILLPGYAATGSVSMT